MPGSKSLNCIDSKRSGGVCARALSYLVIAAIVSVGCNSQPAGSEIKGTVTYKGKPVYPAVVMLKGASGKSYTAKLTAEGGFRVFGVEKGKYQVAIETIKLGTNPNPKPASTDVAKDESGFPTRELTAPAQYKNANVNIPRKYNSFDTSELVIDCTDNYPEEPIEFTLGK